MIQRRTSIPQELEDPEDCTIGESVGEYFESKPPLQEDSPSTNGTKMTSGSFGMVSAAPASNTSSTNFSLNDLPRELRNLLAGGIAGMIAKSFVAPLDRIKILYQVSSAEFHLTNVPGVVRNIIQTEGLSALWKGNIATMIRIFPYSGIQFMVFDRCKRYFLEEHERGHYDVGFASNKNNNSSRAAQVNPIIKNKHGLTALESLVGGMIAGSISVVCTYPLDLARAQLAVLKQHKHTDRIPTKSLMQVMLESYQHGGVRGLFRGISPTLLGILPYSGIAFSLNEQGKRKIQSLTQRELTTMERMQCGAFAGLIAQTATYPIEVTRRRMQTLGLVGNDTAFSCLNKQPASGKAAVTSSVTGTASATFAAATPTSRSVVASEQPQMPESIVSTVRHLYQEQGIRGFFKGVSMNWIKGPVAFSISFTTFDTVQGWLESDSERRQRLPQRFNRT